MKMTRVRSLQLNFKRGLGFILTVCSIALLSEISITGGPAQAGPLTPEGKWKTVSDTTGKETSIVRIWKENDKLFGKVEVVLPQEGQDPNPLCNKCQGKKKDQPITGMMILWDLTQNDEGWDGGYILDPDDGKSYNCKLRVVDNGNKLEVRGYIGFSLLGRTQTWQRVGGP